MRFSDFVSILSVLGVMLRLRENPESVESLVTWAELVRMAKALVYV